jgi:Holliday junction DNA helicase RuvB
VTGGPAGIRNAGSIDDTAGSIPAPYLMQIGFLDRTSRGRRITPRALEHLDLAWCAGQKRLF